MTLRPIGGPPGRPPGLPPGPRLVSSSVICGPMQVLAHSMFSRDKSPTETEEN